MQQNNNPPLTNFDKNYGKPSVGNGEGGFIGIIPQIKKDDDGKEVERDARKNVTIETIKETIKEATEWKPKLSPFMQNRQKSKQSKS